jgi:hypothetical protein
MSDPSGLVRAVDAIKCDAVVTSVMIFITLIPLFVEALGRATEGRPYLPPSGRADHRCIF